MKLVAYISEYTGSDESLESDLKHINRAAAKRNKRLDISGVLIIEHKFFLQIMEGPDQNVENLLNIIRRDRRHKNMKVLLQQEVFKRDFHEWNMDQINLSHCKSIDRNQIIQFTEAYKANLIPRAKELALLYTELVNS